MPAAAAASCAGSALDLGHGNGSGFLLSQAQRSGDQRHDGAVRLKPRPVISNKSSLYQIFSGRLSRSANERNDPIEPIVRFV